jgi:hypothetical protein
LIEWTPEKLTALNVDQLKSLRENAEKLGGQNVVELCDVELAKRKPKKIIESSAHHTSDDAVIGFHFVCDRGQGVTKNSDGTHWTGTWVVDKCHAERAAKIGAYVALHETKSETSYLQGLVKDWRVSKRERQYAEGQTTKTETGIDFLFEITDISYQWVGGGSGEKGYAWASAVQGASS